jgi:hypothetical protein
MPAVGFYVLFISTEGPVYLVWVSSMRRSEHCQRRNSNPGTAHRLVTTGRASLIDSVRD